YRRRRSSRRRAGRRSDRDRGPASFNESGDEQPVRTDGSEMTEENHSQPSEKPVTEGEQMVAVADENGRAIEDRERAASGHQNAEKPHAEPKFGEGITEISGKVFGFLRDVNPTSVKTPQDIFVPPKIVRRFQLREGMWFYGEPRRGNRGPQLIRLLK